MKMWASVRSLVFSICSPMGLMSIEGVPIDPEVMVPVDWSVFQFVSGALRGWADAVSEG